jgi:hypothetical protein
MSKNECLNPLDKMTKGEFMAFSKALYNNFRIVKYKDNVHEDYSQYFKTYQKLLKYIHVNRIKFDTDFNETYGDVAKILIENKKYIIKWEN